MTADRDLGSIGHGLDAARTAARTHHKDAGDAGLLGGALAARAGIAPGAATILGLQRQVGNRAVSSLMARGRAAVTVQPYRQVSSGDYVPPARQREAFERHAVDPTATAPSSGVPEATWQEYDVENPRLLVADDNTMAIQDTAREPREFFATDGVVKTAVTTLEDHHSLVSLQEDGQGLRVEGQTLKRVSARSRVIPLEERGADEIDAIVDHICINVANTTMGLERTGRSHAVVLKAEGASETEGKRAPLTSDSTGSAQIEALATLLGTSSGPITPTDTAKELGEAKKGARADKDTGRKYGDKLGRGELQDRAKEIGVNQHADPQVGEAFATYSIQTDPAHLKEDFSSLASGSPTLREFLWGYHFAAVVAESEDRADKITFENYNRSGDILEAFKKRLLGDYPGRLDAEIKQAKGASQLAELCSQLKALTGPTKEQAETDFKAAVAQAAEEAKKAWFFRMYGTKTGSGQTFHEKSAASGYFANPLTVRVAAPDGTSDTAYKRNDEKRYAELSRVLQAQPLDYDGGNESYPVRTLQKAQEMRNTAVEALKAKTDESEAREEMLRQLRSLRDDQLHQHWLYAKRVAKESKLPASEMPPDPTGPDETLRSMGELQAACKNRAAKYREKRFTPASRANGLEQSAKRIEDAHSAVVKQQEYYEKYL